MRKAYCIMALSILSLFLFSLISPFLGIASAEGYQGPGGYEGRAGGYEGTGGNQSPGGYKGSGPNTPPPDATPVPDQNPASGSDSGSGPNAEAPNTRSYFKIRFTHQIMNAIRQKALYICKYRSYRTTNRR